MAHESPKSQRGYVEILYDGAVLGGGKGGSRSTYLTCVYISGMASFTPIKPITVEMRNLYDAKNSENFKVRILVLMVRKHKMSTTFGRLKSLRYSFTSNTSKISGKLLSQIR